MAVADADNAVLAPAVGAGARMVVRKVFPSRSMRAVILADCAPLPLGEVRSPALPMHLPQPGLFETLIFRGLNSSHFPLSTNFPGRTLSRLKKARDGKCLSSEHASHQSIPHNSQTVRCASGPEELPAFGTITDNLPSLRPGRITVGNNI